MFPTLKPGQEVLARHWFIKVRVGDLIILKKDRKEMVKRVQKISGNEVFVVGDNKKMSTDSRHFGPVKQNQIIGKIIYSRNKIT